MLGISYTQVEIGGVSQMSSVHIKRCRYLAESGCAGMCINLCKSPTQVTIRQAAHCRHMVVTFVFHKDNTKLRLNNA